MTDRAQAAKIRAIFLASDPANLAEVFEELSLEADRPTAARRALLCWLAEATAAGLPRPKEVHAALFGPDAGLRLRACQALAAHLPEELGLDGPQIVDWMLWAPLEPEPTA